MPAHRMNMRMIKDVLRLKFDGDFGYTAFGDRWIVDFDEHKQDIR